MTRRPGWTVSPPRLHRAATVPPRCDPDDPDDIGDLALTSVRVAGVALADRTELADVALTDCDVAGFTGRETRVRRLCVTGGRLRGVVCPGGLLEDVALSDVTTSELSVRFGVVRRLTAQDCDLSGLDLTEASLVDVRLTRCRLVGAHLDHVRVGNLRLEGCDLSGLTGADSLRGASIHPDDVATLAVSLAGALGIRVEE